MSATPLTAALRHVRDRAASERTDAELLADYRDHRDEFAFEAIDRRHGPMVLGVCRRLLGDRHDAEDAAQATFLLLARKAASVRKPGSLASWLHGTAHRVASQLRRSAGRRRGQEPLTEHTISDDPAEAAGWREVQALLEQEIARLPEIYREAFVLCCVERHACAEVARQIGQSAATVRNRVARARKRLRDRLARRGVSLSMVLAALDLIGGDTSATVIDISLTSVSLPVARLINRAASSMSGFQIMKSMLLMLALTTAGLCAAFLGGNGSESAVAGPSQQSGREPSDTAFDVTGVVLKPDGKAAVGTPVELAHYLSYDTVTVKLLTTTDGEGRFRTRVQLPPGHRDDSHLIVARADGFAADWVGLHTVKSGGGVTLRLAPATVPVRGRVITLEGRPVPGVTVRLEGLRLSDGGHTLKDLHARWPDGADDAERLFPGSIHPVAAGLPEEIKTDAQGRFEVRGVGDGRLLTLSVTAEPIETSVIRVAVDKGLDIGAADPPLYGPTFDHAARPCRVITGKVTDRDTGEPLAGIHVSSYVKGSNGTDHCRAVTDEKGNFRLLGLPNVKCQLFVAGNRNSEYLWLEQTVGPTEGLKPAEVEIEMPRGVEITGRVVDGTTGQPIEGFLVYYPLSGNQEVVKSPDLAGVVTSGGFHGVDADGRFRILKPAGLGVILIRGKTDEGYPAFTQVNATPADREREC